MEVKTDIFLLLHIYKRHLPKPVKKYTCFPFVLIAHIRIKIYITLSYLIIFVVQCNYLVKIPTNMLDWCNILDILSHFYGLNLTYLFYMRNKIGLRKTCWRIKFAATSFITNPPHSPLRKLKYWCSLSLKRKKIIFLGAERISISLRCRLESVQWSCVYQFS